MQNREMDTLYCIGICLRIEEEVDTLELKGPPAIPNASEAVRSLERLNYWTRGDQDQEEEKPQPPREAITNRSKEKLGDS